MKNSGLSSGASALILARESKGPYSSNDGGCQLQLLWRMLAHAAEIGSASTHVMTRVLNCGVDDELRRLRALILELAGCTVVSVKTAGDAMGEMSSRRFDVILLCHQFGIEAGKQVSDEFRQRFPAGKLVVIENVPSDPDVFGADVIVSAFHPADMVSAVTGVPAKVRPARAAHHS